MALAHPIDNSMAVCNFVPERDDGDRYIYTELLDRSKNGNRAKLMKAFYHRSREEFWEQFEVIKDVCDMYNVRACTRLSPRSFKKTGRVFTSLVVEASLEERWGAMRSLYQKAAGNTPPEEKFWIWDIDKLNDQTVAFHTWLMDLRPDDPLKPKPYVCTIASKTGCHHITRPFDVRRASNYMEDVLGLPGVLKPNADVISLHKDNPTNLYIPEDAD